jgi:hypothetical protein
MRYNCSLWSIFTLKQQGQIVPKLEPKRLGEKTGGGGGYDNQRRKDLPPPLSGQDFLSNGEPERRRAAEESPPPSAAAGLKREAAPLPPLSSHSLSLGADLSSCDEVKVSAS